MTIEQSARQDDTAQEIGLLLCTDDGVAYVIPVSVVERHRLSDEQRAALEAQLAADGGRDTAGHQFIGTFGGSVPVPPGPRSGGGWTIPYWLPAHYVTSKNRDDPSGYRPPVR